MELILKQGLPHQQKAIDAVCDVFEGVHIEKASYYYMNPAIDIQSPKLKANIEKIQQGVHPAMRGKNDIGDYLNIDIKMETGTGKTYVYTQTIFELHKRCGINKFIIAVPSLAIKAGTGQFIADEYVKRHFRDVCKYDAEIELQVLESRKGKKGKISFPSAVREFVKGSSQNKNKIYVLLTNMHLLTDKKNTMLVRDDYDVDLEGFQFPIDSIRATRPIVIIDEPHRFAREQKTFEFIEKRISPQCIIRFGATFPIIETGKGKNKVISKDFHHMLYDLNACDSFNLNLIKGVAKEHFDPISNKEDKVKIATIESKTFAKLHYYEKGQSTKVFTFQKGDPLSLIASNFDGIFITAIGTNYIELSNGQIKYQGEEFSTDIYSSSYQEQMIRLALQRHFETEKSNFNRKFKIKTLALFFIDDIYSYRTDEGSGKEPYLLNCFERLLAERIDFELSNISEYDDSEYKEYLIATKNNISASHAGYFSQDNSDSDEEIAKEVNEILFEKKKLLSIKNTDGSYNTRRFLFSKWTLKEGWDNPNVFTIAKLRSSGSENSKLQEVGRGLRLPVDEFGNRVSNEEFMLNYIVDFTEADFANELIKQINDELPGASVISRELIQKIAKKLGMAENEMFKKLLINDFIDLDYNINIENIDSFYAEYPDFAAGINRGKVEDRNKPKLKPIKIRKAVYAELKELWEAMNQKYMLYYDNLEDAFFDNELLKILEDGVFGDVIITSHRDVVKAENNRMGLEEGTGVQYIIHKPLVYSEFLNRINLGTNIPIIKIHNSLIALNRKQKIEAGFINEYSVANFINKFNQWKAKNLQGRFRYKKSNLSLSYTALTNIDGTPKDEIVQGRIGTKLALGEPSAKYLYDAIAYDSPLEKQNIISLIDEIIVYGKIPRNSIRIPTTMGGSYSPDFMYVVKKANGEKTLNVVVETKDVEDKSVLRDIENSKIECAKIFFEQLKIDGYEVKFFDQLNNRKMAQIIKDALA